MSLFGLLGIASCISCLASTSTTPAYLLPTFNAEISNAKVADRLSDAGSAVESGNVFAWLPTSTAAYANEPSQQSSTVPQIQPILRTLPWLASGEQKFCTSKHQTRSTPAKLEGETSKQIFPRPQKNENKGLFGRLLGWWQHLTGKREEADIPSIHEHPVVVLQRQGWQREKPPWQQAYSPYPSQRFNKQTIATNDGSAANNLKKVTKYQIWVKGYLVAEITNRIYALQMATNLESLLQIEDLDGSQIQPSIVRGIPGGTYGDGSDGEDSSENRILFLVTEDIANQEKRNNELLAIEWVNKLRIALSTLPFSLVEAQTRMHGLAETDREMSGLASWYGPAFHGRLTATGETFDQQDLTAAHPSLPFNTYLKVTNTENGRSAIVRINDRGPYVKPRILDLSWQAARCLQSEVEGVVPVDASIMEKSELPFFAVRVNSE